MPATRIRLACSAFFVLCTYGWAFSRYRALRRAYDELCESYAGVHAGLLLTQERLLAYQREQRRYMAFGLAATDVARFDIYKN